jgi:hypothetical protein
MLSGTRLLALRKVTKIRHPGLQKELRGECTEEVLHRTKRRIDITIPLSGVAHTIEATIQNVLAGM